MKKICTIMIALTMFISCVHQKEITSVTQSINPQNHIQEYHISEALDSVVLIQMQYTKKISVQVVEPGTNKITIKEFSRTFGSSGTAVYLGDGFFLTAAHVAGSKEVVKNPTAKWNITYKKGNKVPVKLVFYNDRKELALFKVAGPVHPSLKPVKFNMHAESSLRPGDKVFAIGHPIGFDYTITDGSFSAVRKIKNSVADGKFIQHSAPINPGNSGGPLLNDRGELLGIISFYVPINRGASWSGLGFAVSLEEVGDFLLDYVKHIKKQNTKKILETEKK